jgi:hypothetical protein
LQRPFCLARGQFPGLFALEKPFFFAPHLPFCVAFSRRGSRVPGFGILQKSPRRFGEGFWDIFRIFQRSGAKSAVSARLQIF